VSVQKEHMGQGKEEDADDRMLIKDKE